MLLIAVIALYIVAIMCGMYNSWLWYKVPLKEV